MAAPRDFPRASPSGNPSEKPCQPLENSVHPSSFTRINPISLCKQTRKREGLQADSSRPGNPLDPQERQARRKRTTKKRTHIPRGLAEAHTRGLLKPNTNYSHKSREREQCAQEDRGQIKAHTTRRKTRTPQLLCKRPSHLQRIQENRLDSYYGITPIHN